MLPRGGSASKAEQGAVDPVAVILHWIGAVLSVVTGNTLALINAGIHMGFGPVSLPQMVGQIKDLVPLAARCIAAFLSI